MDSDRRQSNDVVFTSTTTHDLGFDREARQDALDRRRLRRSEPFAAIAGDTLFIGAGNERVRQEPSVK